MTKEEKEKGWDSSTTVFDANCVKFGEMICKECGGNINKKTDKGLFLYISHFNIYHRGNKTQWGELIHKKCSLNNSAWEKFELKNANDKAKSEKELALLKQDAINKINSATYIEIDSDKYGREYIFFE